MPNPIVPNIELERPGEQGDIAADIDQQIEEVVSRQYQPIPPRPENAAMVLMNLEAVAIYDKTEMRISTMSATVQFHKQHPAFMGIISVLAASPLPFAYLIWWMFR